MELHRISRRSHYLLLSSLVALLFGHARCQPPAPPSVAVVGGNTRLTVSWPAVVSPAGQDPVLSYQITVTPNGVPTTPVMTPIFSDAFPGSTISTTNWRTLVGPCPYSPPGSACPASGAPTASMAVGGNALTFSVPGGQSMLPLTAVMASSAFGVNGAPLLLRPAGAPTDVTSARVFYALVAGDAVSAGLATTNVGLVMYDADPGGSGAPRPLLRYYMRYSGSGPGNINALCYRYLTTLPPASSAAPAFSSEYCLPDAVFPAAVAGAPPTTVELYMIRDPVALTWGLYWNMAGGAGPASAPSVVVQDAAIMGSVYGGGAGAWVGLFAEAPGAVSRTPQVLKFASYSQASYNAYQAGLAALAARTALIAVKGVCAVSRTVTRSVAVIPGTLPGAPLSLTISGLLNGAQYTTTVGSVGAGGPGPLTFAPGVSFPSPPFPNLASGATPALWLDSLTLKATGAGLDRWPDVSGNMRDFVQPMPGLQPQAVAPTVAVPAPGVLFPTFTATEMVQENSSDTFFAMTGAWSDHEMSVFALYQPTTQYYYSMNLLSLGADGTAGWQVDAMYSGGTCYAGMKIYGANTPFSAYPAGTTSPWPTCPVAVGISRNWPFTSNPDAVKPTLLTYDYWRTSPATPSFQLDGCIGLNTGTPSDLCNNPAGDNSVTPGLNSGTGNTWQRGFHYDSVWGPRFPSVAGNTATYPSWTNTAASSRLKISDATYLQGGSTYNQNWLEGSLFSLMVYKPRVASQRERQNVQGYLLDRYGQRCPANAPLGVTSSCATGAASNGGYFPLGTACTQSCAGGASRIGGATVLSCNVGAWVGRALVCGFACPVIPAPLHIASCAHTYVSETFGAYPDGAPLPTKYDVAPLTPAAAIPTTFYFKSGALVGDLPPGDDTCSVLSPATLMTNAPAWADPTSAIYEPLTHTVTLTLTAAGARGGLAFRTFAAGGGITNMYRFSIAAGVDRSAVLEKVVGGVVTSLGATTIASGSTVAPGTPATLTCTTNRNALSCAVNGAIAFAVSDTDIASGGGGLYVNAGRVVFSAWSIVGACDSLGNCKANAGEACSYSCAAGYSPSAVLTANLTQTCTPAGTYDNGGAPACVPTPPYVPAGQSFSISEASPAGFVLGAVNGTAPNAADVLLWTLNAAGNNETERDSTGAVTAAVSGVFGMNLCSGGLTLAKGGVLNYNTGSKFFWLSVRATVGSNAAVFTDRLVYVNVTHARAAPSFPPVGGSSASYTRTVPENSAGGTLVGAPVSAVSTEAGQVPLYDIVFGNDAGLWNISNATGQLSVARSGTLDYEVTPSYLLIVRVRDAVVPSLYSTVLVTINLLDVNDPPVAQSPQLLVVPQAALAAGGTVPLGLVSASDEDQLNPSGDTLHFALLPASSPCFALDPLSGNLSSLVPLNMGAGVSILGGYQCLGVFPVYATVTDTKAPPYTVPFNVSVCVSLSSAGNGSGTAVSLASVLTPAGDALLSTRGGDALTVTGAGFAPGSTFVLSITAPDTTPLPPPSGNLSGVAACSGGGGASAVRPPLRVYASPPCTLVDSGTLGCISPAGWGISLSAQLLVNGVPAVGAVLVAYKTPALVPGAVPVPASPAVPNALSFSTEGGQVVNVPVTDLCPGDGFAANCSAALTVSLAGVPLPPSSISVNTGSTPFLVSFVMPAGVGSNLSVDIALGGAPGTTAANNGTPVAFVGYAPPVITNVSGSGGVSGAALTGLSTNGGQSFTVTGRNFGPAGSSAVTYGSSAPGTAAAVYAFSGAGCFQSAASPNTVIICTTAPGVGAGHAVTVTAGGQASAPSSARLSYAPPNLTAVGGPGAALADTAGGQTVVLSGTSLGPLAMGNGWASADGSVVALTAPPVSVWYGRPSAPLSAWYAATGCAVASSPPPGSGLTTGAITCSTVPGTGTGFAWALSVGGQNASAPVYSGGGYAPPVITGFALVPGSAPTEAPSTASFNTSGGQLVDLIGGNFGPGPTLPPDFIALATSRLLGTVSPFNTSLPLSDGLGDVTFSTTACTLVVPFSTLRCAMPPGAGVLAQWTVRIDGQNSTAPVMAYAPPAIGSVRSGAASNGRTMYGGPVASASPDGDDLVLLWGANFGPGASNGVNCINGSWFGLASTPVAPDLAAAFGATPGAAATAPGASALSSGLFVPTCYGYVQSLRLGRTGAEFAAADFTVLNDSAILVRLPPGYGSGLVFTVSVADRASLPSGEAFSYAPPAVGYLSPAIYGPTDGSAGEVAAGRAPFVVTIVGTNFGLTTAGAAVGVAFGNAGDRSASRALLTPLTVFPDMTSPASLAAYRNSTTYDPLTGAPIRLQRISFALPPGLLPSRGVSVVVYDAASGPGGYRVASNPLTDGAAFAYTPPNLATAVLGGLNASDGALALWLGTQAAGLAGAPGAGSLVYKLMLGGSSLGPPASSTNDAITRLVEASDDGAVTWTTTGIVVYSWTDTAIVAYTTRQGATVRVRATGVDIAGAPISSTTSPLTYFNLSPAASYAPGGDYGGPGGRGFSSAGGSVVPFVVQYLSAYAALSVTVDNVTCPLSFSNGTLLPLPLTPGTLAAFASSGSAAGANASSSSVAVTLWTLYCVLPPGQGAAAPLVVVSGTSASNPLPLRYAPPAIVSVEVFDEVSGGWAPPPTLSTGGGSRAVITLPTASVLLRVNGSNFGRCPVVMLGGGWVPVYLQNAASPPSAPPCSGPGGPFSAFSPSPDSTATDTSLLFWSTPGEGSGGPAGFPFYVSVGGQVPQPATPGSGATNWAVRFAPPLLTFWTPSGLTDGGDTMAINGANFGVGTPIVLLGNAGAGGVNATPVLPCTGVVRSSPTQILCSLPEGAGAGLDLTVIVADQNTTARAAFSYDPPSISGMLVMLPPQQLLPPLNGSNSSASPVSMEDDDGMGDSHLWMPVPLFSNGSAPGSVRIPAAGFTSTGGTNVTLLGANFGPRPDGGGIGVVGGSGAFCVFVPRYGRPAPRALVCDGLLTSPGEGEVPDVAITAWSHSSITFVFPPGTGVREIVPFVAGQVPRGPTQLATYAPPVISSLTPTAGATDGGEAIYVRGSGFGAAPLPVSGPSDTLAILGRALPSSIAGYLTAPSLPGAATLVTFMHSCVSGYNDTGGYRPAPLASCSAQLLSQNDSVVAFPGPPGIGVNRSVSVIVLDQDPSGLWSFNFTSAVFAFSYAAPFVTGALPHPVPMDGSDGKVVKLAGTNFGRDDPTWTDADRAVSVLIGGLPCGGPARMEDGRSGAVSLQCGLANQPVGHANITYIVAGQAGFTPASSPSSVFLACAGASPSTYNPLQLSALPGFFGRTGETCLPCPSGAFCGGFDTAAPRTTNASIADGGVHTYPRPLFGYFNLNSSDDVTRALGLADGTQAAACPPAFNTTGRDVCIAPCVPAEACAGDNHCAYGYASTAPYFRCASCAQGFYQSAAKCIACPDSPAALFVGAALLLVCGAGLAYVLNKKKVNIGYISIGVDYFQILAIFASSKVAWPASLLSLFHILSAFNLNIEIVAPECLIPSLAYQNKWFFIMLLPLGIMGCFALFHVGFTAYKRVILGRTKNLNQHTGSLVSSTTMLMYIFYIYLVRNVLDVFNCAPTDPDDGHTYLQAVFVQCGVPGGVQLFLVPFGVIAIFVYVIGYPVVIGVILYRNRELIMEDQLLRAKGTGYDRLTNPNAYEMRKRYRNVYYQFKPDYIYWAEAILLRKFLLAVTYIMFNRNSAFQLAAALLVMFLAYVAQVRVQPYMSPGAYDVSIKAHETAAAAGSAVHGRLRERIARVEARGRKNTRRNILAAGGAVDLSAVMGILTSWLFDYNTVEAVLLFSAVIVALMGLMFASQDMPAYAGYYAQSTDAITAVTLAVIILSIIYFVFVITTEIIVLYNESARRRQLEKAARSGKRPLSDGSRRKADMAAAIASGLDPAAASRTFIGPVDSVMSPLFLADKEGRGAAGVIESIMAAEGVPSPDLWRLFQASYGALQEEINSLSQTIASSKTAAQKLEAHAAMATDHDAPSVTAAARERRAARARGEFAPTGSHADPNEAAGDGGALLSSQASLARSLSGFGNNAATMSPSMRARPSPQMSGRPGASGSGAAGASMRGPGALR